MTPIKFRAYHFKEQRMFAVQAINFEQQVDRYLQEAAPSNAWHSPAVVSDLMPFTGLVDKHGTEIYEGDIVHYLYQPGPGMWNFNQISVIDWQGTGFYLQPASRDTLIGYLVTVPGATRKGSSQVFEVLGNIYEHAALGKRSLDPDGEISYSEPAIIN